MGLKADELKERAKRFAVQIVWLYRALPRTEEARILGRQLLRSATSVAANYRAVCRARSRAEFISKLGIVVEESDETVFWLEMLEECQVVQKGRTGVLLGEARELLAIFAASQKTARSSSGNPK